MTDPVMRLQLHCIPSFQSGYFAEMTITCRDLLQSCDWPRYLDELFTYPFSLSILLVVLLLVHLLYYCCSGLTPISKISTRAFVAYSWFGPPLCPFAGVY